MPNSQFDKSATLGADGSVHVTGKVAGVEQAQDVDFRFMIVQGDAVVEGRGRRVDGSAGWSGDTDPGQARLAAGPALAIGLAALARSDPAGGLGYETFTWSEQIELAP
jgi:hypothetical protein